MELHYHMLRIARHRWLFVTLASLILHACGGGDGSNSQESTEARVYKANSPYKSVLVECVDAKEMEDACNLAELPLLGMVYNDPGIPHIMDRVVTSHQWMGERFEALLSEFPEQMLPLFKGVTAIVIDADIRPAYYSGLTGAIYIDPAYLWLTVEEKQTINPQEDYRSGFDDPLAFRALFRFVQEGHVPYRNLPLTDNSTRELEDITLLIARPILHELAHANDYAPPDVSLSTSSESVWGALSGIEDQWVSSRLNSISSLSSETLFSLAGVMYRGYDPTIEDLEISSAEVGTHFENDGGIYSYSYTSEAEDIAMLVEASLMKYFFDADLELAFTGVPEDPTSCSAYEIGWGQIGRIADESVWARAKLATQLIAPHINFGDFFETLESPLNTSGNWCINSTTTGQQKGGPQTFDNIDLLRPYL